MRRHFTALCFVAVGACFVSARASEYLSPEPFIQLAQAPEGAPPAPAEGEPAAEPAPEAEKAAPPPPAEQPPPPPPPPKAEPAPPPPAPERPPPPKAEPAPPPPAPEPPPPPKAEPTPPPPAPEPPPAPKAEQPPPPPQAEPVPAPPATAPGTGEKRDGRGGKRKNGDGDATRGEPQPPPPPAPPASGEAQPPAPTPPAAAPRDSRDRRGDRSNGRDGEGKGPRSPDQPPQQAQPAQPPAAPPQPAAITPPPPPPPVPAAGRQQAAPTSIEQVKKSRRQRVEAGGKRTIIEEPGRTIVQEKGARPVIRADETERMRRSSGSVRSEKRPDGGNVTIAVRPGGIEVFSEFDGSGRLTRRYRRERGRDVNLIDNRRFRRGAPVQIDLGPITLRMPRERYIVNYERASEDDIYDALTAGPVERLPRGYSLDEIRYNTYLRDRMRRVDLDTVTFDFGAWRVRPDQYNQLERIANAMHRALDRNSDEVFLVEGHTDAVGSEIDNLTLSDRRAEEVAIILTDTFGVPFENLVTQGYGEEFLKVPTLQAERVNRRVAVRRITPLLAREGR